LTPCVPGDARPVAPCSPELTGAKAGLFFLGTGGRQASPWGNGTSYQCVPGAGAMVQAQLWYRDPLNTSNQATGLSAAFEFCVGP